MTPSPRRGTLRLPAVMAGALLLALGSTHVALSEAPPMPAAPSHLILRNGLANARLRFTRDHAGRVVFLGGSITASGGWRDLVGAALQQRFPDTRFDFVNAGNPSMGSTPDAFRFARDVLARGPVDLLFVDAAVNDALNGFTPVEQVRGMEGLVRQARVANPACDVVLLYFGEERMFRTYDAGQTPEVIASHERVAAHYGLPSVNLPREMSRAMAAKEYTLAQWGGVHPSKFGHELYARQIMVLLDTAWAGPLDAAARVTPHTIPEAPLDAESYCRGRLLPVRHATLGDGWRLDPAWQPTDKLPTRGGFVGVPTLVTEQPGGVLTLAFDGPTIGLFIASGPDAGVAEFSVDGGPWRTRELYTQWSRALHLPWAVVLDGDLAAGPHELRLRAAAAHHAASTGHAIRIMHFLVN